MKLIIDIPFEAYYTFKCDLGKGNLNALAEIIANGKPYGEKSGAIGKWIFHKDFNDSIKYGCNQCGNLTNIPSNFCPNCGKSMKKYLKGAGNEKET